MALPDEDTTILDAFDAPLRFLDHGTAEAFGGVTDRPKFADCGTYRAFDMGREWLKPKISVPIPTEGAVA